MKNPVNEMKEEIVTERNAVEKARQGIRIKHETKRRLERSDINTI